MRPPFPFETAAPAPPAALLRRFDRCPARHPALPPLADFTPALDARELREALGRRGQEHGPARGLPLHLLVRAPCASSPGPERGGAALVAEADALARAIGSAQRVGRVTVVACGAAALDGRPVGELLARIAGRFPLGAASVRVETAWPGVAALRTWRAAGVSCLLLDTAAAGDIEAARALGFDAVTVRVACGRHGQVGPALDAELRSQLNAGATGIQLQAYASTLDAACAQRSAPPGPIALFEDRSVLRARAIATLLAHGLRHAGRGLFAGDDDPLVRARARGRLHLEVDGLAAAAAAGTLAIGAGAFGRLGSTYYRNAGSVREHAQAVALHGLGVAGGIVLSAAGQARRAAVAALVCHGRLDFEAIALAHGVEPRRCFARELKALAPWVRAGLVDMDSEGAEMTPQGEHLVDTVVAVFDRGP